MRGAGIRRTVWIAALVVLLVAALLYVVAPPMKPSKVDFALAPQDPTPAEVTNAALVPIPRKPKLDAAVLAKIIGITNFSALNSNQIRQFQQVVVPGVSNFISVLQKHGVSRFDAQAIGPENFVSLHDPKPGNIWDLKLKGNNGRDYFMRFNQTQEMGIIGGLTNVVSFFPMTGPSIQGVMEGFARVGPEPQSLVEVRSRSEPVPENTVRNLSRAILADLGNNPRSFTEILTTTERASGIAGGYIATFRPPGLDQPDNALYDTTFGFVARDGHLVLDTFTYNSARLLPPGLQRVPPAQLPVPRF